MQEPSQFNGPILLFISISQFFGIVSEKLTSYNGIRFSQTRYVYCLFFGVILNIVMISGVVIDILDYQHSLRARSVTARFIWICDIAIIFIINSVGIIGAPQRLKCIINVLQQIKQIRRQMGSNRRQNRFGPITFYALLTCVIGQAVLVLTDFYFHVMQAINLQYNVLVVGMYSLFYVELFIQVLLELHFYFIAVQICKILKDANDELLKLIYEIDRIISENNYEYKKDYEILPVNDINHAIDTLFIYFQEVDKEDQSQAKYCETIHLICSVHEAVLKIIQDINKAFGLLLLLFLISFLLYLVITPYYIIMYLQSEDRDLRFLFLQLVWLPYHGFNLALIVEPCHYTNVQKERTRVLVSQIIRRANLFSDSLYNELHVFSKMLMLEKSSYTPYGMCTLGRPLIVALLGSVSTYLIIIFQFQSKEIN